MLGYQIWIRELRERPVVKSEKACALGKYLFMYGKLMLQKTSFCLSKIHLRITLGLCSPQTWAPHQFRSSRRGGGRERSWSIRLTSTGSSRLQASAVFLDVPGLLFTATAGILDRDNRSIKISTSETWIASDLQQKAKICQGPVPSIIKEQNWGGVKQLWFRYHVVLPRQYNFSVS